MRRPLGIVAVFALSWLALGCEPTRKQVFIGNGEGLSDGTGADGTGDQPGPVPDAGPDLTLDPSATFEWEQTLAGDGECAAGDYLGTYDCSGPDGPLVFGVISFKLIPGTSETGLFISAGTLTFLDSAAADTAMAQFLVADLAGQVNCQDGSLEAVGTEVQQLSGAFPWAFIGPYGIRIDGLLDSTDQRFSGELTITATVGVGSCTGAWTAKRMP